MQRLRAALTGAKRAIAYRILAWPVTMLLLLAAIAALVIFKPKDEP